MSDRGSVLFVDDEVLLRDVVVEALQDHGYEVLVASDGPGAIELLSGPLRIDVVFSDVSMPNGMSGVELAGRAAQIRPGIRVLLASGFAKGQLPPIPTDVHFLPKPYRIGQLVESLERLVGLAPAAKDD
ncbi:response regulator [Luteimonas sp. SX5]|uniref:Response regulator n=1 Tax=Luteimonas galliterrae TaxID=2940486 RepID=A0ABT0MF75_9GAMM|nr:response regulator [Luteimonas galliterrae]MCL1633524.1 response regulator [Luteimonas galliterrae]